MTKRKRAKKKKLKWTPMQMYRVPLSQEQAVLTCCDYAARGVKTGTISQCGGSTGCTGIGAASS